jgi:carbon monoxide dehydrogenase subunit G
MRRMRVVSHERIEVRPEQVFDCVTNPGMWPSYIDDLASVELLTPPPIRVGTRVQVVQLVDGREFHATEEFTEVERPRRSASHIRDARRPNLGTYQLEPADGGTLVTYTFETRLRFADALLGAVLLQKIGTESRIREHRARALAKLKGVLEAEAPLVSPAR